MKGDVLRQSLIELVQAIRDAGRGQSRHASSELIDQLVPALFTSADPWAAEPTPAGLRERIYGAALSAAGASTSPSKVNPTWASKETWVRELNPRPRVRVWSWRFSLAAASVLVLIGWAVYQALRPKEVIAQPNPESESGFSLPDKRDSQPNQEIAEQKDRPENQPPLTHQRSETETAPDREPKRQSPAVAQKESEAGRVEWAQGEPVLIAKGDSKRVALKPGTSVPCGSTIETGDTDNLLLRLRDGTVLKLDFNTRLEIPSGWVASSTRPIPQSGGLHLSSGRLFASVTHLANDRRFRVQTPAANAEVLGTEFSLRVEKLAADSSGPDYKTTLQVTQGRVRFTNEFGDQTASAGTESWATDTTAPTEPKRLNSQHYVQYGVKFSWEFTTHPLTHLEVLERIAYPVGTLGAKIASTPEGSVWVGAVEPHSSAAASGLKAGSLIVSASGREEPGAAWINGLIGEGVESRIELLVMRKGRLAELTVPISRRRTLSDQVVSEMTDGLKAATRPLLYDDARAAMARLKGLAVRKDSSAVQNNLGLAQERLGEYGPAVRAYAKAVRLAPREAIYRANLGMALASIGNRARAIEELELAVKLDPHTATPRIRLSEQLLSMRKGDEAVTVLKMPDAAPASELAKAAGFKTKVLICLNRAEETLISATEGVRLAEDTSEAWMWLSAAQWTLGMIDKSVESCQYAVQLDPTNGFAFEWLACALSDAQRQSEAETAAQRAIELEPFEPDHYSTLASIYRYQYRSSERSIAVLERALFLGAYGKSTYSWLIELYADTGRFEKSRQTYRQALRLWPEDPMDREFAHLLQRQGMLREAEDRLKAALLRTPEDQVALMALADLLKGQYRLSEAEQNLQTWTAIAPDTATPHAALCRLRLQMGRLAEAKSSFERVRTLCPKGTKAWPNRFEVALWLAIDIVRHERLNEAAAAARKVYERARLTEADRNAREAEAAKLTETLIVAGRAAEAVEFSGEYLKQHGETRWMRHMLILSKMHSEGGTDEVLKQARTLAEGMPEGDSSRHLLGEILARRGEVKAARRELEPHGKAKRVYEASLAQLADILKWSGRLEQALREYEADYAAIPTPESGIKLSEAHFEAGSMTRGLEILKDAARRWPDDWSVKSRLIEKLVYPAHESDEALSIVEEAVAYDPNNSWIVERLGHTLASYRTRDPKAAAKAEEVFKRALLLDSNNVGAWNGLGLLYIWTDRFEEAKGAFRHSHALSPDDDFARGALLLLERG